MHYRNGREAKNGDTVVQLEMDGGKPVAVGQLVNAVPGNDTCNGQIVVTGSSAGYGAAVVIGACLCDCLHVEDVTSVLADKGLDKRPVK
jgi:hypothetical protein